MTWRGRGAAIKAAAIKSENALADDLEIVSGDLATPASVSVKLDKLTQSCKVLLPTALSEKVGKLPTLPAPEHSRFPSGLELRTIIRLRYIELCSNLLQIAGERTPQGHSLSRGRHGS